MARLVAESAQLAEAYEGTLKRNLALLAMKVSRDR
jgi:hypothetical protein